MSSSLVSIIIPAYNRGHLIGETLDSILKQTYLNWECIVVDDGSNDDTIKVLQDYQLKDSRIQYYSRPSYHLPGGNGARNYGLNLAQGDFVIFFDSDDLMTKDHVETKLQNLLSENVDYVIAKTKFLNDEGDKSLERYYTFTQFDISVHNYVTQNINWLTYDAIINSNLAKEIYFNEYLKSGQEYNYFSKLVIKSTKAKFIPEYLTLRRKHIDSKQGKLKNKEIKYQESFFSIWLTYLDVANELALETKKVLLFKCITLIHGQRKFLALEKGRFIKELYICFGWWGIINFIKMYFISKIYAKRGHGYRDKFKMKLIK